LADWQVVTPGRARLSLCGREVVEPVSRSSRSAYRGERVAVAFSGRGRLALI